MEYNDLMLPSQDAIDKMNEEFSKMNNEMFKAYTYYTQKFVEQNIINTVTKIKNEFKKIFVEIDLLGKKIKGKKILKDVFSHFKNQEKIYENVYDNIVSVEDNFVIDNCFVDLVESVCRLSKLYIMLEHYNPNNSLRPIICDMVEENLELIITITRLGVNQN